MPKKGQHVRLIAVARQYPDWVLGFADETWWNRFARPHRHTWADSTDGPLRLIEQKAPNTDPDPKALTCYGILLMNIYSLLRTDEATIAQKCGGGLAPVVGPDLDHLLQGVPLVGPAVQVQDLGVELAARPSQWD